MSDPHKLKVFLCHASQDKPIVRELYRRLSSETWIDPWLDEEKLLPGQDWVLEIEKAVETSDAVIVCLSSRSVSKEGYVQKELRKVLDIALEKPEDTIFIIPLRLDDCELPRRLRNWHYVDYFPAERQDWAFQRLQHSLQVRSATSYGIESRRDQAVQPVTRQSLLTTPGKEKRFAAQTRSGRQEIGWSIPLILYFLLAGLDAFIASNDVVEYLIGICAVLAAVAILVRREIPASVWLKISLILYLVIYSLGYRLESAFSASSYVAGLAALASSGIWIATIGAPRKRIFYSSFSFALFLFLTGVYRVAENIQQIPAIALADTLLLVTGLATSALIWKDL